VEYLSRRRSFRRHDRKSLAPELQCGKQPHETGHIIARRTKHADDHPAAVAHAIGSIIYFIQIVAGAAVVDQYHPGLVGDGRGNPRKGGRVGTEDHIDAPFEAEPAVDFARAVAAAPVIAILKFERVTFARQFDPARGVDFAREKLERRLNL
jgi:hypothetical protein